MGAVSFSLDPKLLEAAKRGLKLDVFVETGTFHGDTIEAVKDQFSEVYSVELSEELYKLAVERFSGSSKIRLLNGNSPDKLKEIGEEVRNQSVLYWLDAHWCVADATAGEKSQCPLLDELEAIGRLNDESTILIDDARLFLAPPQYPHEISDWPTIDEIIKTLGTLSDRHEIMVVNDVIAFFPKRVRAGFISYAQEDGINWLDAAYLLKNEDTLVTENQKKEEVIQELLGKVSDLDKEIVQLLQFREYYNALPMPAHYYVRAKMIARQRLKFALGPKVLHTLRHVREFSRPKLGQLYQYEGQAQTPHRLKRPKLPNNPPTISIVTPSFNQGRFIERTIRSVLDQNYPRLEYFVQDGGSKDETTDVLRQYGDRLTGWTSQRDNGQSQAINLGLAQTSGEIMGWLNSDDILLPNSLAIIANYFATHPLVDVVYGDRLLIDEQDREIGKWILPGHDAKVLSWADYVPQETMFWRRRIWDKVGGQIDESFRFAMDWDLILRFRDAGAKFAHIPDYLGGFRIHEAQKTSAAINEIGHAEMDRLRERSLGRMPSRVEIRRAVLPFLARHRVAHILRKRPRKR